MLVLRHFGRFFLRRLRLTLAKLLRLVPGIADALGLPTRVIWNYPAWVAAADRQLPWIHRGWRHVFTEVYPSRLVESTLPLITGETIWRIYKEGRFVQYPPLGVALLRPGRIATSHGVVMEPGGGILEDFNYYWMRQPSEMPIFERFRLPAMAEKTGVHATILSPDSTVPNYYHWMAESLLRLAMLDAAGVSFDTLIVPERMSAWQRESLALLGYNEDRLSPFGDAQWRVENLLVPSLVGFPGMCHPWPARWLRERLGVESDTPGTRRLYISRAKARSRRVLNEQEVLSALQPLGFDVVFPEELTFRQQLDLFGQAEWIVSIHGAGLANVLFAPRGARVLEFITAEPEYISTSFYSICCALGHKYGNVCVDYPHPRAPAISDLRRREDWIVPLDGFHAAFKLIADA